MSLQNSRELAMVNDQVYRREEIENLKKWLTLTDWTKPATRYLVHGPHLSGKTIGANTLGKIFRIFDYLTRNNLTYLLIK